MQPRSDFVYHLFCLYETSGWPGVSLNVKTNGNEECARRDDFATFTEVISLPLTHILYL
jgi:hypothetical protein